MNDIPSQAVEASGNPSRRAFFKYAGGWSAGSALATLAADAAAQDAASAGPRVTDFAQSFLRWTLDTKLKPPGGSS